MSHAIKKCSHLLAEIELQYSLFIHGEYVPRRPVNAWDFREYQTLSTVFFFLYVHIYDKAEFIHLGPVRDKWQ